MAVTFLMLIVFGLILFVIMGNNIEPKPQIESKPTLREGAFYDYANTWQLPEHCCNAASYGKADFPGPGSGRMHSEEIGWNPDPASAVQYTW